MRAPCPLGVTSALALTLTFAGCTQSPQSDDTPVIPPVPGIGCTEELRAGLVVEVRDAPTGLPAADGATGEITDGGYTETLLLEGGMLMPPNPALQLVGAWERPGIYNVSIAKAGYRFWRQPSVVVTADSCHVETVRIQAALEPVP
jgi:hypothetical protein